MQNILMRVLIGVTLLSCFSGCSMFYSPTAEQYNTIINTDELKHWQIYGRIGLVTTQKSISASFIWHQSANNDYTLQIFGPLRQGEVTLQKDKHGARLTDSQNRVFYAQNTAELLTTHTNWELPDENNLRYWIKGSPNPKLASTKQRFNRTRELISFNQDGWQIEYPAYYNFEYIRLPRKILLQRNGLNIKIIINSWN